MILCWRIYRDLNINSNSWRPRTSQIRLLQFQKACLSCCLKICQRCASETAQTTYVNLMAFHLISRELKCTVTFTDLCGLNSECSILLWHLWSGSSWDKHCYQCLQTKLLLHTMMPLHTPKWNEIVLQHVKSVESFAIRNYSLQNQTIGCPQMSSKLTVSAVWAVTTAHPVCTGLSAWHWAFWCWQMWWARCPQADWLEHLGNPALSDMPEKLLDLWRICRIQAWHILHPPI